MDDADPDLIVFIQRQQRTGESLYRPLDICLDDDIEILDAAFLNLLEEIIQRYLLGMDKLCTALLDALFRNRAGQLLIQCRQLIASLRHIRQAQYLDRYRRTGLLHIFAPVIDHVYRALGVIAQESDLIQSELYKNSLKVADRNTHILYYDCTNFFFEIEQEEGLRQYGISKEHRPCPIVQMGLFMICHCYSRPAPAGGGLDKILDGYHRIHIAHMGMGMRSASVR